MVHWIRSYCFPETHLHVRFHSFIVNWLTLFLLFLLVHVIFFFDILLIIFPLLQFRFVKPFIFSLLSYITLLLSTLTLVIIKSTTQSTLLLVVHVHLNTYCSTLLLSIFPIPLEVVAFQSRVEYFRRSCWVFKKVAVHSILLLTIRSQYPLLIGRILRLQIVLILLNIVRFIFYHSISILMTILSINSSR